MGKKDGSIYLHKKGKIKITLSFGTAVKSSSDEVLKDRVSVFSEML